MAKGLRLGCNITKREEERKSTVREKKIDEQTDSERKSERTRERERAKCGSGRWFHAWGTKSFGWKR